MKPTCSTTGEDRGGAAPMLRGAAVRLPQPLDAVFAALADPIRRGILARLTRGSCSVSELGEPFPVSAPAISKHLSVLEHSGLIERWRQGRVHFCRLVEAPLEQAGAWIEQHRGFWERQLDALESYLNRDETTMPGDDDQAPRGIRLRRYFRAAPEKVFRAWTGPGALMKWWCPKGWTATAIEVDLRSGGEYRIGMIRVAGGPKVSVAGRFVEVVPPRRLKYTWRWEGAFPDMPETLVTVEFVRSGTGTELTLCHEKFDDAEVRQQHWIGWVAACNRLEQSLPVA